MSVVRSIRWFSPVLVCGLVLVGAACRDDDAEPRDAQDGGDTLLDGSTSGQDASTQADAGDAAMDASVDVVDGSEVDSATSHDAGVHDDEDAGDDDAGGTPEPLLEIAGRWHNSWGGTEVIDTDAITAYGSTSVIHAYDNHDNWLVTQNPSTDPWNPSKYNKLVWTEVAGGSFYYCTVDYGRDTFAEARNSTNAADATDPENTGCGGFSWTKLSAAIEIEGRWESSFGGIEILDSDSFVTAEKTWVVALYDNDEDWLVTQNPASDADAPSKFNKIVWVQNDDGTVDYCVVERDRDSAALARDTDKSANRSNRQTGCRGYPWTRWTAAPVVTPAEGAL